MRRKVSFNGEEVFIYAHSNNGTLCGGCADCVASSEHEDREGFRLGDCGMPCGGILWRTNIDSNLPEHGQYMAERPEDPDNWEWLNPADLEWQDAIAYDEDGDVQFDAFDNCFNNIEVFVRRKDASG